MIGYHKIRPKLEFLNFVLNVVRLGPVFTEAWFYNLLTFIIESGSPEKFFAL